MQIFKNIIQCLSFLIGVLLIQTAAAQTPTNLGGWQPNGDVRSIISDNDYIYLGGSFTSLVKEGTSGIISSGTGVEQTGIGEVVTGFPQVSGGSISAVVSDGSGGWFIGGDFTKVGGVVRNRIAHILPDKTLDMTWNPNASSPVKTLSVSGTDLYVGGSFTVIGGQSRNRIAKLSTTGTGAADATWNPNVSGSDPRVFTLAVLGTDLYVGGDFSSIGGQSRNYIAKLSTTGTGAADATWNPNADNIVETLSVLGTDLYVGGFFTSIGGQSRNYIAKLSTTGTGAADATWNPNPNSIVRTLTVSGTDLYVGGFFSSIGGQIRSRIAKLSTTGIGAADATWNPNANGEVYTLAISGTDLYVGGSFTVIGGQTRSRIAKLSTTGTGLANATWNPNANSSVFTLAISGTDLYVGGFFTIIGGQTRNSIARLSKATLELDMTWNPNANNVVSSLAISGTDLYVGGSFTSIGGQTRNRIAKLSTTGTGVAEATWNPNANNTVSTLAISGTDLYVGGHFTSIGGQTRSRIAKLSTTGIGLANATWNPNSNDRVLTLFVLGTDLYVGGFFTTIGGQTRNSIAKLSTTGTGAVDATWNPNANSGGGVAYVSTLSILGADLYVGGLFASIGGRSRTSIAKLSTIGTGAADATWNPNPSSFGFINTLAISSTDLYVGGNFNSIGGQTRNQIAKLSTTGTGAADATWNPNANSSVFTLAVSGTNLYVGGGFTAMGNDFVSCFAIFGPSLAEINVQGGSPLVSIVDGNTSYSTTDNTDFGSGLVSSSITKTFTIQNTGTANLTVSSINVTGTHNTEFVVTGITFPATILPNATTTFNVAFTPTAIGLRTATITINNNDTDEGVYDFAVQGTGIVSTGDVLLVETGINYPTIQAAVDAATTGQTIRPTPTVVPKNYDENVVVDKNLTFSYPPAFTNYTDINIDGIKVNTGISLTIDGNMSVNKVLEMEGTAQITVNVGRKFALRSTATETALVINGSPTTTISGDVIMERYMPAVSDLTGGYDAQAYHLFSSPFIAAPISQFGDDMSLVLNTAYNTAPEPAFTRPFPTFFHYQETNGRANTSAYFNPFISNYKVPTTTNLEVAKGYQANIATGTTVDLNGTLNNGIISIGVTNSSGNVADGYNLVGNPYPSPIDWDKVHAASTGVENALYLEIPTSQYDGRFAEYVAGTGVINNGGKKEIASMQGFFVRTTAGGTVTMNNTVRLTSDTRFYKTTENQNAKEGLVRVALVDLKGNASLDETTIYFQKGAKYYFV